ncbi:hypothetical protein ACSBR2_012077 [Camellia fascicularis]
MSVMEQWRGNGGWIPVVRHRKGGGAKRSETSHGLFTIFVDNLPQTMDVRSLFKFFTKFGIVKDAFIPFKRRVVTNSRFGFVRFDCSVAANIAIQKANGLLVDDRVLEVKNATYGRGSRVEQSKRRPQTTRRFFDSNNIRGQASCAGQKSFAEVLKGNTPIEARNEKGLKQVLVRKGGGRDVVLTFNSQEELKSNIYNIKEWFREYSQSVGEWKPGFHYEQGRCFWLRCYGIPLNFWNRNTFNNIGNIWGTVLNLDGDITYQKSFSYTKIKLVTPYMELINKTIFLEYKGQVYPILVCEDHIADINTLKYNGMENYSSNEIYCSKEEEYFSEESCRKKKEDDEVAAECGKLAAKLACTNTVALRKEPIDCYSRATASTAVKETKWDGGCS